MERRKHFRLSDETGQLFLQELRSDTESEGSADVGNESSNKIFSGGSQSCDTTLRGTSKDDNDHLNFDGFRIRDVKPPLKGKQKKTSVQSFAAGRKRKAGEGVESPPPPGSSKSVYWGRQEGKLAGAQRVVEPMEPSRRRPIVCASR